MSNPQEKEPTWYEIHGHLSDRSWPAPRLVARSDKANRADQNNMIRADEYLDEPEVLEKKMKLVAELVKKSKFCVTYTGAGLSKAAGIPDYATKSESSVVKGPKLQSSLDAQPTLAHRVLTSMERAGYIKNYIQQNHDGLPQKAGFPQEKINEIHGAWFDPSNPVVPFSGSLRGDLFQWMLEVEEKADLCLCLGTSLSGMNADRVARTPAERFLKEEPGVLGTVLINLQRTKLDRFCTVRVWAKLDDAFSILARELSLSEASLPTPPQGDVEDVFVVPYDKKGKLSNKHLTRLDLREGSEVQVSVKEASNCGLRGVSQGKDHEGNYLIRFSDGALRVLGWWWIEAALRGVLVQLPVANLSPALVNPLGPGALSIVQSYEHLPAEENEHRWGLRLEGDLSLVDEVEWWLHPTFSPDKIRATQAPFSITRQGWGTFTVKAKIKLKHQKDLTLQGAHELSFENEGERAKATPIL